MRRHIEYGKPYDYIDHYRIQNNEKTSKYGKTEKEIDKLLKDE